MIMLEYTKSLLLNVSFDKNLFIKELRKCISWLGTEDKIKLRYWSILMFYPIYEKEITEIYNSIL